MSFAATVNWEVRATGSDGNGGGFDAVSGTPGTDYSQQDAAQVVYGDLVIDGATATKVTSAAHPFSSVSVGNILYISGGTNFTVGRYQVVSVSGSTATCDRNLGTLGSTGGIGVLGGALASPGIAASVAIAGNVIFVKYNATPYAFSASSNVANGRMTTSGHVVGYDTTRTILNTDANRPILKPSANNVALITTNDDHVKLFSLDIENPDTKTGCTGITGGAWNYQSVWRCKVKDIASAILVNQLAWVDWCEVGNASAAGISTSSSATFVTNCTVYGGFGIVTSNTGSGVIRCNCYTITGTGITVGTNCLCLENSVSGCSGAAGHCYSFNQSLLINCIAEGAAHYGFTSAAALNDTTRLVNCSGHNNTDGDVNSAKVTAAMKLGFIACSATPFTDAASGDLSLNDDAGGGALLRGLGFPAAFPGGLTLNYLDIGAAQTQSSAGGGGYRPVMRTQGT